MATPLPKNHATFTVPELALLCDAKVQAPDALAEATVVGVSTDSRSVRAGELFVPLRGETFDGHDHVGAAAAAGVRVVLVDRDVPAPSEEVALLRVPDTLRALRQLANAHRRRWASLPGRREVIAITGSAGKTTTRHATAHLLRLLGHDVLASVGNLNNFVGAPMSALGLEPQHDVAVLEVGMNQPGEIATLAAAIEPTVGVLTLVSHAHTEGVGSIWGVAREKSDLLAALPTSGVSIVNADVALAAAGAIRTPARRRLSYGRAEGATVRLLERAPVSLDASAITFELAGPKPRRISVEVKLLGEAGASACLAAVCAALAVDGDLDDAALRDALAGIPPNEAGRLDVHRRADDAVVINDAYNANPASMRSSIRTAAELATLEKKPLVLVLGAMFELGDVSEALHREVGEVAAETSPRELFVVGPLARPLAEAAESRGLRPIFLADANAAAERLATLDLAGAVVLVKASNSVGLGPVAAKLAKGTK